MRRELLLTFSLFWLGCAREEQPLGPEHALEEFIEVMQRVHGNPQVARQAFELIWQPGRENLSERARRASALSGRTIQPEEMIAPSWFSLGVVPERIQAEVQGDAAELLVIEKSGRQYRTRAVREKDGWKVALELPELAPIRQRRLSDDEKDD